MALPGPLAPPESSLPRRNITALSYSCTTLKQMKSEKGIVRTTRTHDKNIKIEPQRPASPSEESSAEKNRKGSRS